MPVDNEDIAAVHSHFDLTRAKQTHRILCAMDNSNFTLLTHPSGRLIDRRGWLEKQNVLDTRPLSELRKLVARQNPGIGY